MNRRVVVTGIGVVSPLGFNVETFWEKILAGKSAISASNINPEDFPVQSIPPIAGQIDRLEFAQLARQQERFGIDADVFCKVDYFNLYGVAAAKQAVLDDAKCSPEVLKTAGVVAGNIFGGVETADKGAHAIVNKKRVRPSLIPATTSSALPGQVSIIYGTQGGAFAVNDACATGAAAVFIAWFFIKHGLWDIAIVPCSDAYMTAEYRAAFGNMQLACSKRVCDAEKASCPFDTARDGFVLSEGGAALVLETIEHALARGVSSFPYGELASCAMGSEAVGMIKPDVDGEVRCMRKALAIAGIEPDDVDCVKAHATSTIPGDIAEADAIGRVFAERRSQIPVIAPKSQLGHMMGAAGAIELIVAILAMRDGVLPPIINLQNIDPCCNNGALNFVRGGPRQAPIRAIMCNSFGFGGSDLSIIIRKVRKV